MRVGRDSLEERVADVEEFLPVRVVVIEPAEDEVDGWVAEEGGA